MFAHTTRSLFYTMALFVKNNHPYASDIPAAYRPAFYRDLEAWYVQPVPSCRRRVDSHTFLASSNIRDQPQSCLVANTRGLHTGIQLTDGDCPAISSGHKRPAIREDCGGIPTANGTAILPTPNRLVVSVVSPGSEEEGVEAKPSVSSGGSLREISSFAHGSASLGTAQAGRPTLSLNRCLEATPSQCTSSPYHYPSVTSPTSDALHPATTSTTRTVDGTSLWRVKARKVLNYLVTKHPKVVSAALTTLVAIGNIVSHAGVSACFGGPILVIVQSVGVMTVAIGKWLRTALDAAVKAPVQMQPSS